MNPSGTTTYDTGTVVSVTATPATGYRFDHWTGAAAGMGNPATVRIDADKVVAAVFVKTWTLLLSSAEGGTLSPIAGYHTYDAGTVVPVTATADSGWVFDQWTGSTTGTTPSVSIAMDGDKWVNAVFKKTFQLWTLVNNNEGGTVTPESGAYKDGTVVTVTATPAADWAFDYWEGELEPPADPRDPSIQVPMNRFRWLSAHFMQRPGISNLDLQTDLQYFVTALRTGETLENFDRGKIEYESTETDMIEHYVGNGIPDAAEFGLLQYVLQHNNLDLSYQTGIASEFTWQAWQQNIAQAQLDLPGADPHFVRAVAAYITLGYYAYADMAQAAVHTVYPNLTLTREAYKYGQQEYFTPDADADSDGLSNLAEWQAASPDNSLANISTFSQTATDGIIPENPPTPEFSPDYCALCRDEVLAHASIWPGPGLASWYPDDGSARVGMTATAFAVSYDPTQFFVGWNAPDTMLSGSRKALDFFTLMPRSDEEITTPFELNAVFLPNIVTIANDNAYFSIDIAPSQNARVLNDSEGRRIVVGPIGAMTTVTCNASPQHPFTRWKHLGSVGGGDPTYSYNPSITISLDALGYLVPEVGGAVQDQITTISGSTRGGGRVSISAAYDWPARYMYAVPMRVSDPYTLTVIPSFGHKVAYWIGVNGAHAGVNQLSSQHDNLGTVTAFQVVFERNSFPLKLKVEGNTGSTGINSECMGYINASPRRAFYFNTEPVKLEAHHNPGFAFKMWKGDIPRVDASGNPLPGNDKKTIANSTDEVVYVKLSEAATATAVFGPGALVSTVQATAYVYLPAGGGSPIKTQLRSKSFYGHTHYPFVSSQTDPGEHIPVFYYESIDSDFNVLPLDVELTATVSCPEWPTANWSLAGDSPSAQITTDGRWKAHLTGMQQGGVYKVLLDIGNGYPVSEVNVVLPFAGGEVKDLILADLQRATVFTEEELATRNLFDLYNHFGIWFGEENGDYVGRPDNSGYPAVWKYDGVTTEPPESPNIGEGGVATLFGVPMRNGKLSNMILGFVTGRVGVSPTMVRIFGVGTGDDASAELSFEWGLNLAALGDDWEMGYANSKETVESIFSVADDKPRQLWPNPGNCDNDVERQDITDYDRQCAAPKWLDEIVLW